MIVQQQAFALNLELLAARWQFNSLELSAYAAEDDIGGYSSIDERRIWPMGSLWEEEGKVIYALVRALKPDYICEIGTHRGCSATHLAAALRANNKGTLYTVDTNPAAGDLIPEVLRSYITQVIQDGITWLMQQPDNRFGLIYLDGNHSVSEATAVGSVAKTKLVPGGVLAAHDAAHFLVGKDICEGLTAALGNEGYTVYLSWPSDCGLGIYRRDASPNDRRTEEAKPVENWPQIVQYRGLEQAADEITATLQTVVEEVAANADPLSGDDMTAAPAAKTGQNSSETATPSGRKGKATSKARKPRSDKGVKRARPAKGKGVITE